MYNSPKNMMKTPKFRDNNRDYYRSNILTNKMLSGSTRASRDGGFFSEHIRQAHILSNVASPTNMLSPPILSD